MADPQLVRDLFVLPAQVHEGDFVLKLTEGLQHPEETARTYVATDALMDAFSQSLSLSPTTRSLRCPRTRRSELPEQTDWVLALGKASIGDLPLDRFQVDHAEAIMAELSEEVKRSATRRHYAQLVHRVMQLAVYPCRCHRNEPAAQGLPAKDRPAAGLPVPVPGRGCSAGPP